MIHIVISYKNTVVFIFYNDALQFFCLLSAIYNHDNVAGCKAEAVGKPEATFFQNALNDLGVQASEAVMIGDVSSKWYIPPRGML